MHLVCNDFDRTLGFGATGGRSLNSYERYRRRVLDDKGFYRVAHLMHVKRYRLNVGTIVEAPVLKVRLRNGRLLGEVEEYFVNGLLPGDSFIRSEEHTSELQSLMRSSYAVFCLKKKKRNI